MGQGHSGTERDGHGDRRGLRHNGMGAQWDGKGWGCGYSNTGVSGMGPQWNGSTWDGKGWGYNDTGVQWNEGTMGQKGMGI